MACWMVCVSAKRVVAKEHKGKWADLATSLDIQKPAGPSGGLAFSVDKLVPHQSDKLPDNGNGYKKQED